MVNEPSNAARRTLRAILTGAACALGLMFLYSCSLIVSTSGTQCQADGDCAHFASGATCDKTQHVCIAPTTTSSSSGMTSTSSSSSSSTTSSGSACDVDGGVDGGGCYACAPTDDRTLLNACTDGRITFDNGRVKGLLDGGTLPALADGGPDAGM